MKRLIEKKLVDTTKAILDSVLTQCANSASSVIWFEAKQPEEIWKFRKNHVSSK